MTNFGLLRTREFGRLDKTNSVHLDYTGSGLHPQSLLHRQKDLLSTQVLGNPHSSNPTSAVATTLVEGVRKKVLAHFNADPKKYCAIFTHNASGAIKLVAESFPFQKESTFALLTDNHNSVNGIREYAKHAGATILYIPINDDLRMSQTASHLPSSAKKVPNLFAYPAQSNFSGVKHSLSHIKTAQKHGYHVLLDAAAFVPTSRLDLSSSRPDFVTISFYKMFGWPTGIGALIARKRALKLLHRPWFAGGTVQFASVHNDFHALVGSEAAFEDGTLDFLGIPSVGHGLDFLRKIGMDNITAHVTQLTYYLLHKLWRARYASGRHMTRVYGPNSTERRGGCVSFDVLTPGGRRVDARMVEKAARAEKISVRVGCFCNPGAAETALRREAQRERECLGRLRKGDATMDSMSTCVGTFLGCVRVSVGMASNERDIDRLVECVKGLCERLVRVAGGKGEGSGRSKGSSSEKSGARGDRVGSAGLKGRAPANDDPV